MKTPALDILLGIAIGVPYEFSEREEMISNSVKDMVGYLTHNQSIGAWSDDSSLTFCLVESLIESMISNL